MEEKGGGAGCCGCGLSAKRYARSEGELHDATNGHSEGVQM